jgi:hypothetical protein
MLRSAKNRTMTFFVLVLYAIAYFAGSTGSRIVNRASGRTVVKNFRLVGLLFLLVATVAIAALVRSKAPAGASDFVKGQVVGEIAIGPAVIILIVVAAAAWWRKREAA